MGIEMSFFMQKQWIFLAVSVVFITGCATSAPMQNHHQTVLIEAEQFTDCGGWKVDTQFIDIMGSPYLLAHGMGRPVRNAETQVSIPQNGSYRLWVRTKNWVPGDWEAPGRFKVLINGQELQTVFGTKPGWNWQKGDIVNLTQGTAELELKDLTGFNGRCDAILLTTDEQCMPDNSSEPMNEWRRQLLGVKMTPSEKEYDLVVVGGGLSGMGSAISAARMGLKVALIQNRPVLGGNGSSEIRVAPRGNYPKWLYPFGDLVNEFSPWIKSNVGPSEQYLDKLREQKIRDEKNIDLFLNHHAYKVTTKDHKIDAIYALAVTEKVIRELKGRFVVDATGHGVIGYWAGADYHMEDDDRMGMSNLWRWKQTESTVRFPEVPWALQLTEEGFPYPNKKGEWFWESGFNKHPLKDMEAIRDHNLRAVYGTWGAIKNEGAYAHADKTGYMHSRAALEWVAFIGGTRETLQILGDVVLSKEDIVSDRQFDDACVIATWGLDLHYAHPLYKEHTPEDPFISRAHFGGRVDDAKGDLASNPTFYVTSKDGHGFDRKKGYAVPYRCLYSRNIENLFVPGRNMSVTHEALGTVRVMQTLGMCGVAVGRAAYLCEKYNTTPRGVYQDHLEEMKKVWSLPGNYRKEDELDFRSLIQPTAEENRFIDEDYFIWGGSVVKGDEGKYHMYYSRWPRKCGFSAWVTHSEIAHAVADSPTGPFQHQDIALPVRGKTYWDGLCTHNPTVKRFGGKYHLYYMGNTGDGKEMTGLNWVHRNNQRVGVAVADSPNGPWKRFDQPLVDVSPQKNAPDSLCTNNPSITKMHDGRYLLIYKCVGQKNKLPFGGPVVHLAAIADSPIGPFRKHMEPVFTMPGVMFPAEDPYIWYQADKKRYYALVKDNHGTFTKRGKSTALFTSEDGLKWDLSPHKFVIDVNVKMSDGSVKKFNRLERPQIYFDEMGQPKVLYFATQTKSGHSFNIHIPLKETPPS